MFRIFARSPLISSYQALLPSAVARCSPALVTVSSSPSCRNLVTNTNKVCILLAPKLLYDQVRNYWGREGRPGWRRRRAIGLQRRQKILEPQSPVIDQEYPLPKDNMDLIPPELFEEERDYLTPEEERRTQNAIVHRINQQVEQKEEGRLFAVVHLSGKQFKVTPEDIIVIQDLFPPSVGDQLRLHKVLAVGGKDFSLVGSPLLDQDLVRVEATVIDKTLSYTKIVFKMWKRKNFKSYRFEKTEYTFLRINLIEMMQPLEAITSDTEKFSQQERFL